jgi:signal transduction histidine kinase
VLRWLRRAVLLLAAVAVVTSLTLGRDVAGLAAGAVGLVGVAIVIAVRRHRPPVRRHWYAWALMSAGTGIAQIAAPLTDAPGGHNPAVPVISLVVVMLFLFGWWTLVRMRTPALTIPVFLDWLILALAVLLATISMRGGLLSDRTLLLFPAVLGANAIVVRMARVPNNRVPAMGYLVAASTALLGFFLLQFAPRGSVVAEIAFALPSVSLAMYALAAGSPSMVVISQPLPPQAVRESPSAARVALLALAVFVSPLTAVYQVRVEAGGLGLSWIAGSVALLLAVSVRVGLAVSGQARAESALRASLREQAEVAALSQRALQSADPDVVMAAAADVVAATLGVEHAAVFETHADGRSLVLRVATGRWNGAERIAVPLGDRNVVSLAFEREEATSSDASELPGAELTAGACVVVMGGGARLGVLAAFSSGARAFAPGEVEFLHSVAYIIGSVVAQQRTQAELRQAQKLEAVGRIAAGVAHEINTPIQFIVDNLRFIGDSVASIDRLLDGYRAALAEPATAEDLTSRRLALAAAEQDLDLDFLREETPLATRQALDGADRVARIVQALKVAGREDGAAVEADVDVLLRNALLVVGNELRHAADVELDLTGPPPVACVESDLTQVFISLLANAAHAVAEGVPATGRRGVVRVATRAEPGAVVVTVADTGTGIPEDVHDSVFDPFFTTKDVGSGTGQGLYVARAVVERHRGTITFSSRPGKGSTFTVRLPRAARF